MRRLRHALWVTGLLLCTAGGAAELPASSVRLDIPVQPIADALNELARQTGLQIYMDARDGQGVTAEPLVGTFTPATALAALLKGTGLIAYPVSENTYGIRAAESKPIAGVSHVNSTVRLAQGSTDPAQGMQAAQPSPSEGEGEGEDQKTTDKSDEESDASMGKAIAEVLVKGSRITNVDLIRSENDVQPYTIFSSEVIARSSAANVEEFLKQGLTMNTTVQTNAQSFASARGVTSSINLRGLGKNETLILINGRRSAGVSVQGTLYQPDINGIPLATIERIEVLPSSASAIYGGAAVGGVVNVILKRSYNGGQLRYAYDDTMSGSAPTRTINGSFGASFAENRTQVMLGGQYSDGSALLLADRLSVFERNVSTVLRNSPSFLYAVNRPFAGASTNIASATTASLVLDDGTSLNARITTVPQGTAPGSDISSALLSNAGTYNLSVSPGIGPYGLQSQFGTVPETTSVFGTLRQSLFRQSELFAEFSMSRNEGTSFTNPFATIFTVPGAAPTNPFRGNVRLTFPSNLSASLRTESETKTATLGLVTALARDWNLEFDYTWSRNTFNYSNSGIDSTAVSAALLAGTINPFADTIANPPNLSTYLSNSTLSGDSTLHDVGVRASGIVASLPGGQATFTVGLGYREEGIGDQDVHTVYPITTQNTTLLRYFSQWRSTESLYVEAHVPLVGAANRRPAIELLDVQLAGRTERYAAHNGTPYAYITPVSFQALNPPQGVRDVTRYTSTNPTLGVKYRPMRDLTLRASFATAFLPPTAGQLLRNSRLVNCNGSPCTQIVDPLDGQTYLISYIAGGNPDLDPQTSRAWNFGLIWEPHWDALRGLRINLEYYSIRQPDYITQPTAQQVVDSPAFADRVQRDPATGLITVVDTSYVNATEYKTNGYDFKFDFHRPTSIGTFGARTSVTLINSDQRQYAIDSPFLEYVGYPNDGGSAKTKGSATFSWEAGGWNAAWTATYISNYRQTFSPGSPAAIQNGSALPIFTDAQGAMTVPSQTYHDVFASYTFGQGSSGAGLSKRLLSDLTLQVGIRNIFNKIPPLDSAYGPYLYSPYGDPRLRSYRIGLTKGF